MAGAKKGGGGGGGGNSKQEAGRAKKAEAESAKKAQAQQQLEAAEAAEWAKGSNQKRTQASEAAAQKADEAARKKREKEALLAAEEEALGTGGGGSGKKAPGGAAQKKKQNKPKNDLGLLEDALQTAADKKVKMKRLELLKKKEMEEEQQQQKQQQRPLLDPLLANTESLIGEDHGGRAANVKRMELEAESGIDAALGNLGMASTAPTAAGGQQKTSAKALYNEFEAKMLPQVKEEYPGLRLSQYKEKVWQLWKKSPENPANQTPVA